MIFDTSFLVDLLRGKKDVRERAIALDASLKQKCIASITVMELWRGALQSTRTKEEMEKVNALLQSFIQYPLSEVEAKAAAVIEADLKKRGELIDIEDILIAGIAKAHDQIILTRNPRHFEKIKDLQVETY